MRSLVALMATLVWFPALNLVRGDEPKKAPNIVVILADDLGYGDVGCYNKESRIPTKYMDQLAAEGMRFVDAHSPSAVCTPTRYGVLTGRYCWRTALKYGVLDGFDPPLLEANRLNLASLLRRLGYVTGCVGKWHLGMQWTGRDQGKIDLRLPRQGHRPGDDVDFTRPVSGGPTERGFDWYFGISASLDMPPYCFLENDRPVGVPKARYAGDKSLYMNLVPGMMTEGFKHADAMPVLTEKAVGFIDQHSRARKPFFLYLPLSAPHVPVVVNEKFKGTSKAGPYGDFIVEMDATVGAVMAALERNKQADNTLLVMTSDNGAWFHYWDHREADDKGHGQISPRGELIKKFGHQGNGPWRGTKADIWEGGHRVPFIVRWPGKVRPGSVSRQLVMLTDLLATFADVGGEALPRDAGEDSISFLPALLEKTEGKTIRTSGVYHSLAGHFALRHGPWVMAPQRGSGGFSPPRTLTAKEGEPTGQLYHLGDDPVQSRNLWNEQPQVVERLRRQLERYQKEGQSNRD